MDAAAGRQGIRARTLSLDDFGACRFPFFPGFGVLPAASAVASDLSDSTAAGASIALFRHADPGKVLEHTRLGPGRHGPGQPWDLSTDASSQLSGRGAGDFF